MVNLTKCLKVQLDQFELHHTCLNRVSLRTAIYHIKNELQHLFFLIFKLRQHNLTLSFCRFVSVWEITKMTLFGVPHYKAYNSGIKSKFVISCFQKFFVHFNSGKNTRGTFGPFPTVSGNYGTLICKVALCISVCVLIILF